MPSVVQPVRLRDAAETAVGAPLDPAAAKLSELAAAAGTEVDGRAGPALELAATLGADLPMPGSGRTLERWEVLATLGAADLTAARVAEAHLDALAILQEAGSGPEVIALDRVGAGPASTWGVFASEAPSAAGPVRLDAVPDGEVWLLRGAKAWCSLADRLSHALVTAHTGGGRRRLFAVDLRTPKARAVAGEWVARGLVDVTSGSLELDAAEAVPVGDDGWYLERPGFAWGGIGVAACWFGGAVGLARALYAAAVRKEPDQVGTMHLGAVDVALQGARAVLAEAAQAVDDGRADGAAGALTALRVRTAVATAAEQVLVRAGHSLGPAPLALDAAHARRVADLQLYLRQHHAERDQAATGRALLERGEPPW